MCFENTRKLTISGSAVAGCSPSVGNTQPWKFCVVLNEKRKAEIRSLIEEDARNNYVRRYVFLPG